MTALQRRNFDGRLPLRLISPSTDRVLLITTAPDQCYPTWYTSDALSGHTVLRRVFETRVDHTWCGIISGELPCSTVKESS